MADYETLLIEHHDDNKIRRILLNRPERRNAQNRLLLVELDDAFQQAEQDDDVRVVILGGVGKAFSSGHDMAHGDKWAGTPVVDHPTRSDMNGGQREGAENRMLQEWHYFFQNTLRWRNLRKITIAQAQGAVMAGGLMLMWACDLIVAADDLMLADVTGARLGMCGGEYFGHPWEFGPRKAKELLLTADTMGAEEAYRIGMVSKVFPRADLEDSTLEFARRIAKVPSMTALLIKEAVNQSVDNMGFHNALNACFTLHQLNHSHWAQVNPNKIPRALPTHGVPASFKDAPPLAEATKDQVYAGPMEAMFPPA